jgi:uncharacterized cofD-like protein
MAEVTGSFERAILESGRVLAVQGQVLPSTLENVTLTADVTRMAIGPEDRLAGSESSGLSRVSGESRIPEAEGAIQRVYLDPADAPAYPGAVHALLNADMIVAGPGSLYTSVLPNLLVPAIADAVEVSSACKVYICNVATQRGETEGYTVGDHVAALDSHVGRSLFPVVLANDNTWLLKEARLDCFERQPGVTAVRSDVPCDAAYRIITADVVDRAHPWRHDSQKLAQVLMRHLESQASP